MSPVMMTRKDFLVGASAALAVPTRSAAGMGRARGRLAGCHAGAIMAARPAGGGAIDYDSTTVYEIVIPSAHYTFTCTTGTGDPDLAPDVRIDWGDGTTDGVASWLADGDAGTYASAALPIQHTYEAPGSYVVQLKGNIWRLNPEAAQGAYPNRSSSCLKSITVKRLNLAPSTLIPVSLSAALLPYMPHLDRVDCSRIWEDPPSSSRRNAGHILNVSASATAFGSKVFVTPRQVSYLATTFCQRNTAIQEVVFPDKTMHDVRNNIYSSVAAQTKWSMTNFPTQCRITCTDGEIRHVGGAWTDFPTNSN